MNIYIFLKKLLLFFLDKIKSNNLKGDILKILKLKNSDFFLFDNLLI